MPLNGFAELPSAASFVLAAAARAGGSAAPERVGELRELG
jgi:hypothetical protein